MKVRRTHKFLSLLISTALVLTMLPAMSTTAYAAYTIVQNLPTSAGSALYNGYIYRVNGNTTISAGTGGNALNVQSGATTVIYIPSGYTLTVYGGNGSGTTGGGAGIYIPSNSTLILTGGGRLVANGGSGGAPSSGSGGGESNRYGNDSGNYVGVTFYTGGGGNGGNGAGGAGAGIGGSGGRGGSGGSGGASVNVSFTSNVSGNPGGSGSGGNSGAGMGNLYVMGSVSVSAYGGSSSGYGYAGAGGYWARGWYHKGWTRWQGLGAGGGGGGGATAGSTSGIGGGGAGGGGGGGGGSGAAYHVSTWTTCYFYNGGGGGGGQGSSYGSAGTSVGNPMGCEGTGSITIGNGATVSSYSGSSSTGGGVGWGSGRGGNGGGYGSGGSGGRIFKAPTATVSNSTNSSGGINGSVATLSTQSTIPSEISSSVYFDQQGGYGGASAYAIAYGTYLPTVAVPTKSQYAFMGYYTGTNGTGTRYYDQRGAGLFTFENTSSVTLYAYWVQNQFNVTFDKQTGTGGTNSIITTGTNGTLPNITPPTKQYFQFRGYYDRASGAGTQYYDTAGTPITGKKLTTNSVLYAFWQQAQFKLTFNTQGGIGGTASTITTGTDGTLPSISVPTKLGSTFKGYFTQSSGGTQIYQPNGAGVAGRKVTADSILYAQWDTARYSITYNLDGGSISGQPASRLFTENTRIPQPTRLDYSFLGWQVDGGSGRTKDLTIPASDSRYAKNITLTAAWAKTMDSAVAISGDVQVAPGNENELKEELKNSFDTMVTDPAKGVTTDDLAGGKGVKLVLSVDQSDTENDHGLIGDIAQGSALKFYDISAKKEINDGIKITTTTLLEIPEPVSVKIPLSAELADKASYRVYRVHNGVAELLPSGPTGGEYYNVENGNIVIRTRKFSTYGVIGAEAQIGSKPGDIFYGGGGDVDVQGKVIETAPGLVYKVDIAWGPMKFEYSLDREWDPDTHMYTEGALNAWRIQGFDGENNRIRCVNHSNGAVKLGLAVTENKLPGVDMSLHVFNEITAQEANSFILPPAPVGSLDKDLEQAIAYMYLSGSPEKAWIDATKTDFTKAAVVTVTVAPHNP